LGRIAVAAHDSPWPFTVGIESPESIGPDRLCAAAAVAGLGALDAVIVDAGTALTVDILSGGAFAGGAIMPGLEMMLRSLSDGTSALPLARIDAETVPDDFLPPGRETVSAIRAGVLGAWRGGAANLVDLSLGSFRKEPPVFLTGGDAGLLAGAISPAPRLYPDLVLEGLNSLYGREFLQSGTGA
jgi:type III pantothenate kinase